MKRYIIITIGLFFLASGCERVQNYNSANELVMDALKVVKLITVKELKNLMESEEIYTLIDVRQKSEHQYGYIPGSRIIPRGSLEFLIENANFWEEEGLYQPEKNEKIIVYCKKGNRCILAAESLNKLGFSEVYALKEGWKGWELTYPEEVEKNLEMLNGNSQEEHVDTGGCQFYSLFLFETHSNRQVHSVKEINDGILSSIIFQGNHFDGENGL